MCVCVCVERGLVPPPLFEVATVPLVVSSLAFDVCACMWVVADLDHGHDHCRVWLRVWRVLGTQELASGGG